MCNAQIIISTAAGLVAGATLGILCLAIVSINRSEPLGEEVETRDNEKAPERAA